MKKLLNFLLLIFLVIVVGRLFSKTSSQLDLVTITINGNKFKLEVAKTMAQKAKGLSDRSRLCKNCGMIFVYQNLGYYPFWMKNTYIPLDIIWLDDKGVVVDIKTGQPLDLSPLTNQLPAQYIIELNPGTGIKIGDTIAIPTL